MCCIVAGLESHCATLLRVWGKPLCYIVAGLEATVLHCCWSGKATVLHCCWSGESYCVTLLQVWGKLLCYIVAGLESHCVTLLWSCSARQTRGESVPELSGAALCCAGPWWAVCSKVHCVPSQLASRLLLVLLTVLWVGLSLGVLSRKEGLKRVPWGTLSPVFHAHSPSLNRWLFWCYLWHNYS